MPFSDAQDLRCFGQASQARGQVLYGSLGMQVKGQGGQEPGWIGDCLSSALHLVTVKGFACLLVPEHQALQHKQVRQLCWALHC